MRPIHLYTDDIDAKTKQQLLKLSSEPRTATFSTASQGSGIVVGFLAAMADVHLGKGATIGSVFASKDYVCPNAVGVDIGCGMCRPLFELHSFCRCGAGGKFAAEGAKNFQ